VIPINSPARILVIQLRRLGDVLLTTPAVEALRRAFPKAEIDFLVERPGNELLEENPNVSRVLCYDPSRPLAEILNVRRRRYDWVVDFLGNPRSALIAFLSGAAVRAGPGHVFHTRAYNRHFAEPQKEYVARLKVEHLVRTLGIPDPGPLRLRFPVSEDAIRAAQRTLADLSIGPKDFVLGVLPFHRRPTRSWPREHVAALLREFHRRAQAVSLIFWGGALEGSDARWIAAHADPQVRPSPETPTLKTLGALLKRCDFVVSMDNGPHHMAMALGVPTLTLFGASRPEAWNPPDPERHPVVRRDELFCIGCNRNSCPYSIECLLDLKPERVLRRLMEAIETVGVRKETATA
jgi:heptosyltransferase-3